MKAKLASREKLKARFNTPKPSQWAEHTAVEYIRSILGMAASLEEMFGPTSASKAFSQKMRAVLHRYGKYVGDMSNKMIDTVWEFYSKERKNRKHDNSKLQNKRPR